MKVAILLHMHQPPYGVKRDKSVHYSMPWVLTHLMREYFDVAYTLSNLDNPVLTVNFSGSLIEQIDDYTRGIANDRFFEIFRKRPDELDHREKIFLVKNFFSVNFDRRIKPFKRYLELYYKRGEGSVEDKVKRFTGQDLRDLQVLFFLTQVSVYYQNSDPAIRELIGKGKGFTEEDKGVLAERIFDIISRVIPLYRHLITRGLSISFTPMYHPILPLLQSTTVARESNPRCETPWMEFSAPDDVDRHIEMGRKVVERAFGPVKGSWPAEGSVSDYVVRRYRNAGVEWIATDEDILHRSLRKNREDEFFAGQHVYRGYILHGVRIFFRDHVLSDLIGFVYSRWKPEDAVKDFLGRLMKIEKIYPDGTVSIILDGENPWEYYPDGGITFLSLLIEKLSKNFELKVFDDIDATEELSHLHPGSWIGGNFNTWICNHEKNIAWTYLARVKKQVYSRVWSNAEARLEWLRAEASDWFWWLGGDHPSIYAPEFDRIFRAHLKKVYENLGMETPDFLDIPIKSGETKTVILPPWLYSTPEIDGKITSYFEWLGAGLIEPHRATMTMATDPLRKIYYIFDNENLYLLLDFGPERADTILIDTTVIIEISGNGGKHLLKINRLEGKTNSTLWKARGKLEIAINRDILGPTESPALKVKLLKNEKLLFVYPEEGYYILRPTQFDPDAGYW